VVQDNVAKQVDTGKLLGDIRRIIEETRSAVAVTVNTGLTLLHWRIGKRIHEATLRGRRGKYGKQILATLSQELAGQYGKGFNYSALTRMVKFFKAFPQQEIVATLSQQLSWSHFVILIPLKETLQREFYAELCRVERWSVRTLRKKMDSMLYERTALSRKPEELARAEINKLREEDRMSPDLILKDPYILDFLGLRDHYLEKDLEDAILRELELFILELGAGFSFIARQKRIQIDSDDFYIDLLLYNRKLRRLVAIDLKLGDFKPEHKGKMELYLRWLEKHEMEEGEASPLGMILCTGGSRETIELLQLDASGIHVAEYMTELPPRKELQKKLHVAIQHAKSRAGRTGKQLGEDCEPFVKQIEPPDAGNTPR
jgi:predicted nuclease of restriction endonuclease-like (RecB) superfamily